MTTTARTVQTHLFSGWKEHERDPIVAKTKQKAAN